MRVIWMRKILEAAVLLVGTLGWWGFVYPELCLTGDVYEQEYDGEADAEMPPEKGQAKEGENMSEAEKTSGTIRIKSKILEYVYQR